MKEYVLITGGSSGLGLELVKECHARGLTVCNLSKNPDKISKLYEMFPERFVAFAGDLTDHEYVSQSVAKLFEDGRVTLLINSAERGVFKSPADYTPEDVETSLQGLRGMELVTTAVLKASEEHDLKIVNILSSAARTGKPKEALYCAAKWGERGYTEALKAAYADTSVKVVAVYPSGMNTAFWETSRDYIPTEKSDTFLDPAQVAKLILDNVLQEIELIDDEQIIKRN